MYRWDAREDIGESTDRYSYTTWVFQRKYIDEDGNEQWEDRWSTKSKYIKVRHGHI